MLYPLEASGEGLSPLTLGSLLSPPDGGQSGQDQYQRLESDLGRDVDVKVHGPSRFAARPIPRRPSVVPTYYVGCKLKSLSLTHFLTLAARCETTRVMSKFYRQFVRQIQFVRNIRAGRSRMGDGGSEI